MGLDFVELIISIEDAFDITIEDEQASEVVTVDDCYKLILNKIGNRDENKCLTIHTFNKLRKVFTEELEIERNNFHPSIILDDLIPKSNRRKLWRKITKKLDLKIPLSIPGWLTYTIYSLFPAITFLGFIGSNYGLLPSYSG